MSIPPGHDPYQQLPQYGGYDPYAIPATSGAHRAAGLMQIVVGSLGVLLAFCLLGAMGMMARGLFSPEQQAELNSLGVPEASLQTILLAGGACAGVPGLLYVILGVFVWRGMRWAVIASVMITSALLLLGVLGVGSAVLRGDRSIESICSNGVPLLVLAALLFMQIRSLRASTGVAAMSPQQQWQQYYGGATGMAPPEQNPPFPSAPPPPPPGPRPGDELPPPPVPPAGPSA